MFEICFKCVEDSRDQSSLWDNLNPAPVKYTASPWCPSSHYGPHNHYQVRLWVLLSDLSEACGPSHLSVLHCTGNTGHRLTLLSAQEERHTWSSLKWVWVSISSYSSVTLYHYKSLLKVLLWHLAYVWNRIRLCGRN